MPSLLTIWKCWPAGVLFLMGSVSVAVAQISPGALSRSHEALEGVTKCASCHDFGAGPRRFRCISCHSEIGSRLTARSGLHAKSYKMAQGEADCARCHMEHNGRNFAMMKLDTATFAHNEMTGFALEGAHARQKCRTCHTAKNLPNAAREGLRVRDLARTFLGLRRDCTGCHQDPHLGQLGNTCLNCHTQNGWTPASGFNHSRAAFPLSGGHKAVVCGKCHTSVERKDGIATKAVFKGLVFATCQSCHTDPHRGGFQAVRVRGGCETCHTTAGWRSNKPGSNFDHSGTKFPLAGRHAGQSCARCHRDSDFTRPVKHERCGDCHEDAHQNQFRQRAGGSDCAACHNEAGYKPTLFTRDLHKTSSFPLQGQHAAVECALCHKPEGKQTLWASRRLMCGACHSDPHEGEFRAAPSTNQCGLCHSPEGFQKTTFSVAQHAQTDFPLKGKHSAVLCDSCHASRVGLSPATFVTGRMALPSPARRFRFSDKTCGSCHADPHRPGGAEKVVACEKCHTPSDWRETLPLDHASTRFRLEGGHSRATCGQCHNRPGPGQNLTARAFPVFAGTLTKCGECHRKRDVHGGQFSPEHDCSSCHATSHWSGEEFDHDKTRYPLDRAHVNVACERCHKNVRGEKMRVYSGTPTECVKCH